VPLQTRPPRRTNKERSLETRTRLLEATVMCLYEVGYAATTGKLAIERAGLSRGAALHHFPSRADLILETAVYIIASQNEFRSSLRDPAHTARERLMVTLEIVWESWNRPHAIALMEIMIGSRSDPELVERFPAIKRQIDEGQRERYWQLARDAGITDKHETDTLMTLAVGVMRGLAISRILSDDDGSIEEAFDMFKKVRGDKLMTLMPEDGGA
jgi:AcrR family transcriptional regulator